MRQLITHFFSVSILEIVVLILNYIFLICFTNWLTLDDFAYYSNFLSLNAVLFTIISFGMGSFVYQNVTRASISKSMLISHVKARGIIAVALSFGLLIMDFGYEPRILVLSTLSGFILSLNFSSFFDVIGKTHIYSQIKFIALISVNLVLVILWRIEAFSLSVLIAAFFINSALLVTFSFFILTKLIPSSISEVVSPVKILQISKLFAITSIITVVIDYSVLFVFSNNLNSELVAGLYLLIKLAIGIKVIDSAVQRIVIEKIQSTVTYSILHKITILRIAIVLIIILGIILFKDLLFQFIDKSIQRSLIMLMPIWLAYLLSNTLNHYGTKLYMIGKTSEYFGLSVIKFISIIVLTLISEQFKVLTVIVFIAALSILNVLEGVIFLRRLYR